MALGTITLTATLAGAGRWVVLTLTCTGMTQATIYRVTADGVQAVRGAFDLDVVDALNAADYEAPQNVPLTYFARVSDGVMTQESSIVTVDGVVDRGGDAILSLTTPTSPLLVSVIGIPELTSRARRDVVEVIGRPDPVVVNDARLYPTGTLTVATFTDADRDTLRTFLASGDIIAFSPRWPDFGFSDVWYFSVGDYVERRYSPLGDRPERAFVLDVQRVSPPPADFLGPAFYTWQDAIDEGLTWGDAITLGLTWLSIQTRERP